MSATSSVPFKNTLFGQPFLATTFAQSVALLAGAALERPARVAVTPNVDHLVSLSDLPQVQSLYQTADFHFADGMPVVWASRWLSKPLPERVTGADLFVSLCLHAQRQGLAINVIGGMPGQESYLLRHFEATYPGIKVKIFCPGMGFQHESDEAKAIAAWVNETAPAIVFVCLGFPRQEYWALHYRATLNTGLIMCVGAAMEFALGLKARAPQWMQKSGLEWLWRLGSEPGKLWRRYLLKGPRFLGLLLQEKRTQKH